ncbi:transcription-repair coupling factor [Floccifex sp.]|uniref:transcription-repair coupling factor n=1 Tax=Floccifex sp. TaxID=2815810 RepID=UPI002A75887F|nr:transcription-repair coupling factor [Floccifex sp.]MDD7280567.1 transcription-repair coupling factor [Erysipelotrichaceae bacterium]MDY2958634.1 transcription-repair coupling factor [Floccifex sp.]
MKEDILKLFDDNIVVKQILKQEDNVGNLTLMEEAMLVVNAFHQDHQTRIIVKENRYQAQQLYNRMSLLDENVLLFVMEESLRVQSIASSPEDKNQMIYGLTQLIQNKEPKIIICNVASYVRYLPSVSYFKENCIECRVNQELDMRSLKQKLNRMGYAKLNYVDRPCTYASRGGIIDIFTLTYENPIRIEFFDTEIESIRFFDVNTQRTIQSIDSIMLCPATDLLFSDEQIDEIKEKVFVQLEKEKKKCFDEQRELLVDSIENDMMLLENYSTEPHLYIYYAYTSKSQLNDYVDHAITILSSKEEVERSYKKLNQENITFVQEMVEDKRYLPEYVLFHDLYSLKAMYFHEFMDFKNPISSEIYPIEQANVNIEQILSTIDFNNTYFALPKDEKEKLSCQYSYDFHFIEPVFYEGFKYKDIQVYTKKELFKEHFKKNIYQKTFKEGQIIENVLELEKNDYVVHEQYGIGQYLGIVTRNQNGKNLDYLHIIYRDNGELFVPLSKFNLVRKYISHEGVGVKLSKLGSNQWQKTKEKVNQKIEEIASRLVELYAARNEDIGFAFPKDDALQREFEEAFDYEPTPDQIQATEEIKREMEKPKPMDHLLCGDVGFGKTEVAMRCAYKAITSGKQVAFLCPTTILSLQHYQTIQKRMGAEGVNIAMVNRFVTDSEIKEIKKGLKEGTIDLVVGTHKLLNKSFKFKDLGLLIIDEEQRFGVEHKEKIKEMKNSIDVLSLSATPIPRTLQMSLIGVRTISQLNTPPAQRHPVQTYVIEKKESAIREVIQRELSRNGQVFYLHNRVSTIYEVARKLQKEFDDVSIAVIHGKMAREEIETIMYDFSMNKYQILVCTTIIETGIDIANANTILIEDADRFGLSQLYQIRGRVGRREKIAYCYLMVTPEKELTEKASKRLKAIKEFTQLGSGYKVAMRDLTIRGAGDLLGPQQAGFIDQIGLDLYLELLSQAIAKKQGKPIEKKEIKSANISFNGYIPESFTDNDGDKLSLYQDIQKIKTSDELRAYKERVHDLYGTIPSQIESLFEQKELDLFVNIPGVYSLVEQDKYYVITMDEAWTNQCDGVKLFEKMNAISNRINLRLTNRKIEISVIKKPKTMLYKVIKLLEEGL